MVSLFLTQHFSRFGKFSSLLPLILSLTVYRRYTLYYLNPFNYLMGALLTFTTFDVQVECSDQEFAVFDTPSGQTCAQYLSDYMQGMGSRTNLINPDATSGCQVCQYRTGADYLYTLNLKDYYYGWRDAAICVIFAFSSYACVYLLM